MALFVWGKSMTADALSRWSIIIGLPGIVVQLLAWISTIIDDDFLLPDDILLYLSCILLIVGLSLASKARGYNPLWGLLGITGLIGICILALMSNSSKHTVAVKKHQVKDPTEDENTK